MSASIFIVISVWLAGGVVLGIGIFRMPIDSFLDRNYQLYKDGLLDFKEETRKYTRIRNVGLGLLALSVFLSWILQP